MSTVAELPAAAPAKPAKRAATFGRRKCCECGTVFTARHHAAAFCTPAHKTAFHNRAKGRAAVVTYAMAWRTGRGRGDTSKAAYGEFCRMLDAYAREDREAGRPPMADYMARLQSGGMFGNALERR